MKRQHCAHCYETTADYTTEHYTGGRRFHFCVDVDACAKRRGDHNDEPPVYREDLVFAATGAAR